MIGARRLAAAARRMEGAAARRLCRAPRRCRRSISIRCSTATARCRRSPSAARSVTCHARDAEPDVRAGRSARGRGRPGLSRPLPPGRRGAGRAAPGQCRLGRPARRRPPALARRASSPAGSARSARTGRSSLTAATAAPPLAPSAPATHRIHPQQPPALRLPMVLLRGRGGGDLRARAASGGDAAEVAAGALSA